MRIYRGILWCVAAIAAATGLVNSALAINLPLQFAPTSSLINWQSQHGVPLSFTVNVPPGSDGRAPNDTTQVPPTGQFSSFVSFGSVAAPTTSSLGSATTMAGNAVSLGLPVGKDSSANITIVVVRAQVGAPYVIQSSSILFGQVIPPPSLDEFGNPLPTGVTGASYWRAEPYTTNAHNGDRFYWSPNAQQVFATQPGQVSILWRKGSPESPTPSPATIAAAPPNTYETEGNYVYRLYAVTSIVSGTAVKPPVTIFWNQGSFANLGAAVLVAAGKITGLNVITNSQFPIRVTSTYQLPGEVPPVVPVTTTNNGVVTTSNQTYSETRTLWYDTTGQSINAYNAEGRVFLEYYGNLNPDGVTHQFLGFEIVDVRQKADIYKASINLGDPLVPYSSGAITQSLSPVPVSSLTFVSDVYRLGAAETDPSLNKFWAINEVTTPNRVMLYWMQTASLGIQWPVLLDSYFQVWPSDLTLYSQYIRPVAATVEDASTTAVQLPSSQTPTIAHQDMISPLGAFVDANSRFYTWVNSAHPTHRALLRYNARNTVLFERVFSWLDTAAQTGPAALASSVSTNLVNVARTTVGAGSGLVGQYFGGQTPGAIPGESSAFGGTPTLTRVDPIVDFNWSTTGPDPSIGQINYAVRWSGMVQAQYSETYTFYAAADDGVRLIVNGQTLVDKWITQGTTEYSGTINLVAGRNYSIEMIYFQGGGGAEAHLRWSSPSTPKQAIPQTQLYNPNDKVYLPVLPSIVNMNATVGQRLLAPGVEIGADGAADYLAGHVNPGTGTYYAADAYNDPLVDGFTLANNSSIIPINSSPDNHTLEVWWFRQTTVPPDSGYLPVYWPSVIAYYNVSWPWGTPNQIVLASKQGGIPKLQGLPLTGHLYYQNDATLPGFNPNEEHALLQGGTVYALRDDLNITNGPAFSSSPFVLLEYKDTDGRPSMLPFQVLREDPSHGYTFNYSQVVGDSGGLAPVLQAPMPLPVLDGASPPVSPNNVSVDNELVGFSVTSFNTTPTSVPFGSRSSIRSLTLNVGTDERPAVTPYRSFAMAGSAGGILQTNFWVFLTAVDAGTKSGSGVLSVSKPLSVTQNGVAQPDDTVSGNAGHYRFVVPAGNTLAIQQNVMLVNSFYRQSWVGSVTGTGSTTNGGQYVEINFGFTFSPSALPALLQAADTLVQLIANPSTFSLPSGLAWRLQNSVPRVNPNIVWNANGTPHTNSSPFDVNKVTFQDRLGTTYLYRGPHDVNDNASTIMRFYYKTQPGFYFPVDGSGTVLNPSTQPALGTITPYLRAWSTAQGKYVGDPILGDSQGTDVGDDNALGITYSAVWSTQIPYMEMARTLTSAKDGLPGVRGSASIGILYQQSQVLGGDHNGSVILHDATRQKMYPLSGNLLTIPDSVQTVNQLGTLYFPTLPPHLVDRFFFNPNVGTNGALVIQGDYVDPGTGYPYIFPNVLSASDLNYLYKLCDPNDLHYADWVSGINGMAVTVYPYARDTNHVWNPDTGNSLVTTYGVGDIVQSLSENVQVDSYALTAVGPGSGYVTLVMQDSGSPAAAKGKIAVQIVRVTTNLFTGDIKAVTGANPLSPFLTLQHSVDLAGHADSYVFDWRITAPVAGQAPYVDQSANGPGLPWLALSTNKFPDGVRATLGGKADVQALSDNWIIARYTSTDPNNPSYGTWSSWTAPQLAEGWIKRVLAGVNPFDQRVTDLLNNSVNDQVSMLTQAGTRWEGNIALNQDTLNNYGLIPIYETVLNTGRSLSVDSGINYGPANDALLLAAGYISDLYTILGNEAWVEANNPTVSVGSNSSFAATATALFPFLGETATVMEQQQDLLRGRDDFQTPGTRISPVYNRLYWNYTRGINSGEAIYAVNFDIKPQPSNDTGIIGASDAAYMFPQGHGDAYGHYLTALFNYYKLLLNPNFSWVPEPEAVTVLGTPVLINYMHERKFAQSAAAIARTGQLIFDLAWRDAYTPGTGIGWAHLGPVVVNTNVAVAPNNAAFSTRYWGADHWACRVGQGEYINWVVGNSLLPAVDPNPLDYGVQKVDRMTVPELTELPTFAISLQNGMDNAEAHLNPLGLPENTVSFDINPDLVTGTPQTSPQPHFEQIYNRAVAALDNAVYAFNQAEGVTQALRSQQDSLSDFVNQVNAQELSYTNQLIEIFGTPYADDIGVGGTYPQNYAGPDIIHYAYVDMTDLPGSAAVLGLNQDPNVPGTTTFQIPTWSLPPQYLSWMSDFTEGKVDYTGYSPGNDLPTSGNPNNGFLSFNLDSHGFISKPANWSGSRTYTGKVQQAISEYKTAWWGLYGALGDGANMIQNFSQAVANFESKKTYLLEKLRLENAKTGLDIASTTLETVKDVFEKVDDAVEKSTDKAFAAAVAGVPGVEIFGLADGGDILSALRASLDEVGLGVDVAEQSVSISSFISFDTALAAIKISQSGLDIALANLDANQEIHDALQEVISASTDFNDIANHISSANVVLTAKKAAVQTAITQGYQVLATRQTYRAREAAIIQGYRTTDAAFRLFQNEKLERYNTLFDLAQRYALLTATAYDYDTGLLGTDAGKAVIHQLVSTRSLGVVDANGNPQYAGSSTSGDPGISSVLAAMWADWGVIKGRLGFNNPDKYGTVVSLRSENFRILPGTDGDSAWMDVLNRNRQADLLADTDIKQYCLQIDKKDGLPVPGIVIPFSTTIANGYNLFGKPLAPGDHNYTESSFATKIHSVGVAFNGYLGMDNPSANSGTVGAAGGSTVPDPTVTFNDPNALAATPYVYLIPVGVDSMRSPPLGDVSTVRTWNVADVAIPMPFNIGDSGFSTKPLWQSSDSLQEPLFQIRKFQAFRPVSSESYFSVATDQYTNRRLIGRSVWNSQWKLVIPGFTLLNNSNDGLDRFIKSVKDVKIYFDTYSYSGN